MSPGRRNSLLIAAALTAVALGAAGTVHQTTDNTRAVRQVADERCRPWPACGPWLQ
jgi:hypothetical protein